MPVKKARPAATVEELARTLRPRMTTVEPGFSYFPLHPIAEDDMQGYLHDPVHALPPALRALLPEIGIVLVPYLDKPGAKNAPVVSETKPEDSRLELAARVDSPKFVTLFFTVKDEQVADYHYFFYLEIAAIVAQRWPDAVRDAWHGLLREELSGEVHGEVDERSWRLKQALLRRPMKARKDGAPFRDYARQAFEDTLTLYMHGICCDIDVEMGPRQIASRHLRKRLETIKGIFPPPQGRAIFPEELKAERTKRK